MLVIRVNKNIKSKNGSQRLNKNSKCPTPFLSENDIIQVYLDMGKFALEKGQPIRISISDLVKTDDSFHLSNDFVMNQFVPKSVKQGYQYMLFVKPDDFFLS